MLKRQLLSLALETCKNLKSEETAFLHYRHNGKKGCQSIPVYENALFVLLLFQSRLLSNIQEAKVILKRLLNYQTSRGFPIYLHEYPDCFSRLQGVKLLAPLYWLLRDFSLYLEKPLLKSLQKTIEDLIILNFQLLKDAPQTYLTHLRVSSVAFAMGELFGNSAMMKRGQDGIFDLLALGPQPIWFSREGIASTLCSLQMAYISLSKSPWSQFWAHVKRTWHSLYHSYIGPFFDEEWTKPGFYDLMLVAYFENALPEKFLKSDIYHLEVALIHPGEEDDINPGNRTAFVQTFGQTKWMTRCFPNYFYSLIADENRRVSQHFYPFNLRIEAFDLVCTKGHLTHFIEEKKEEVNLSLFFSLTEELVQDPFRKAYEIIFISKEKIFVEDRQATTFQLKDTLTAGPLKMQFLLHQGTGDFFGALKLMSLGGKWKIILRAVRKSSPCIINVKMRFGFKV